MLILGKEPPRQVDHNGIVILVSYKKKPRKKIQPEELKVRHLPVRELYKRQKGLCFYCLGQLEEVSHTVDSPRGYTRDHFFPKQSGNGLRGNMVLSCFTCNNKKDSKSPTHQQIVKFMELYDNHI